VPALIKPTIEITKAGNSWAGKGSSDGTYLYVPITTGEVATLSKYDTQGMLLWESNLSGGAAVASSASPDGSVFVISGSGSEPGYPGLAGKTSTLAKFSATGGKLWEVQSSSEYFADVAITDSTVYVSGQSKEGINSGKAAIYAYSFKDGQLIWSKNIPGVGKYPITDIEIVDGSIYVSANTFGKQIMIDNGIVGQLDLNGNEKWFKGLGGGSTNSVSSVCVVNNKLISIGTSDQNSGDLQVTAFNKNDGTVLWAKTWEENDSQVVLSGAVLSEKIYVSYLDGNMAYKATSNAKHSVVELDKSGKVITTYKFDVPSASYKAGGLIKVGKYSLYMLGTQIAPYKGKQKEVDMYI